MSAVATPLVVIEPETIIPAELVECIAASDLTGDRALAVQTTFCPFFLQVAEWKAKIETVTDPKVARESRLMLRKIRVEAEHTKDDLKGDVLKYSRAVDGAFRKIESAIRPMESQLEEIEKAAERAAAALRAKLIADRSDALRQFGDDPTFYVLDAMSDVQFAALLERAKTLHSQKIAAEAKAAEDARLAAEKTEADRIAREQAEAAEQERVRLENERLKREADERVEAARFETARRVKLHADRVATIRPFLTPIELASFPNCLFYADMADEVFGAILDDRKFAAAERERLAREQQERDAKAAQERADLEARIERERADAVEKERIARQDADAAVMLTRIDGIVDSMTLGQIDTVGHEVEQYLLVAPDHHRQQIGDLWSARKTTWMSAYQTAKETARIERERVAAEQAASAERARVDREAREKAEAELRAADEARAAKEKADREAIAKAARAPDREKLLAFATVIRGLQIPDLVTPEVAALRQFISEHIEELALFIEKKAGEL